MSTPLQNKVLIVTGASSGIGAATAVEAGFRGMRVVLVARRKQQLDEVGEAVRGVGGQALAVAADVADPEQVDGVIARTLEHYGSLHAFFANAGFGMFQRGIERGEEEKEREMWAVNYFAAVHGLRAAAEVMIDRKTGGHLLMCSSVAASTGLPYKATYAATKGAMHGFAASLRVELEEHRIHVTTVYPAATESEFSQTAHDRSGGSAPRPRTPRFAQQSSEHVARRVVAALARPRAEVWPSRPAHWAASLWTLFPGLRVAAFRRSARAAREGRS